MASVVVVLKNPEVVVGPGVVMFKEPVLVTSDILEVAVGSRIVAF